MIITAIIVIIIVIILTAPEREYKKTNYCKLTHNTYQKVRSDLGLFGEYMCYKYLLDYEKVGARFLFNIYIPRDDTTTEIDVLMIHPTGLYVLESKNYRGWIFGTDTNTYWTQTLPQGNRSIKEKFLNPVIQNNSHIKYLKRLIGEGVPCNNIVVFSERCTFKNVTVNPNAEYKVIKRNFLRQTIAEMTNKPAVLAPNQIEDIFNTLYPYSQVTEETKQAHIQNINQRFNNQSPVQAPVPVPSATVIADEAVTDTFSEESTDSFCPDCGAAIVLRTFQSGQNAGKQMYCCSNSPNCGYIKDKN